MVARVTLAEVDAVRMSIPTAVKLFEESVLPELHEADGYEGCYVLVTPAGKALVTTFWRDEPAAEAGIATGLWRAQAAKFATIVRTPPGRETYDVVVAEAPAPVA